MTRLRVNSDMITEEMARTISRLLNNIALGPDRILNKALKTYRPLIVPWLVDVQWGVISVRAQTTPNVIFFAKSLHSSHKINSRT